LFHKVSAKPVEQHMVLRDERSQLNVVSDEMLPKRLTKYNSGASLKNIGWRRSWCGSTTFAVDVTGRSRTLRPTNFECSRCRRRRQGFRIHASRLASLRAPLRSARARVRDRMNRVDDCAYVRLTGALGTTERARTNHR